jgi:Ca2+-binding RTX toxin-like protein
VTLNLAGARIVLGGNFTVAGSLPTAGTITSLTYSTVSGTPVNEFAVTGLSMSYGSFMDAMADNDFNTVVGNGADWISGSTGNDKHYGGAGNDRLEGLAGNDSLFGGAGNDTLFGGAGNDSLQGGNGNDIYVVDSILDRVVESAGGGVDGVRTGLSAYTLGANIENLQFTGVANFTGTGNGLNNLAVGSRGNDSLVGLDGNDTLRGGNGHDTLIGGNGNDFLVGDVGHGTVTTSVSGISPSRPNLPMTLSMTMAETSLNNSTTVTGFINNNTQNTPKFNLAFVLDVSGSMATPFGGATVGDINANGYANERLDAAIASFNALVNAFSDRVDGDFGANILSGGGGNDRLNGSYGDDTLIGGTGDDYLDGGEGWDSVSYAHLTAGVKVNLGTGVVVTTTEGTDTLSGVEAITGGSGNDVIGWAGSESNG